MLTQYFLKDEFTWLLTISILFLSFFGFLFLHSYRLLIGDNPSVKSFQAKW